MTAPARPAGRLGRLPFDHSRPNIVLERRHFTALAGTAPGTAPKLPTAPQQLDNLAAVFQQLPGLPMYGNADWGDCVWAMAGHAIQVLSALGRGFSNEITVTTEALLKGYSDVTGFDPNAGPPGKNPTDQGTNIQKMLEYWQKVGIVKTDGAVDKILAFAQIDHTDRQLVQQAALVFGVVLMGINFPDSAMNQFRARQPWAVVKGAQIEGGHAILMGAYTRPSAATMDTVDATWGELQEMEDDFYSKYTEEAWIVVTQDMMSEAGKTSAGFDFDALKEDYSLVTNGKPFPGDGPAPKPAPTPAPAVWPVGWDTFVAASNQWMQHLHVGYSETYHKALKSFLRRNGVE